MVTVVTSGAYGVAVMVAVITLTPGGRVTGTTSGVSVAGLGVRVITVTI